MPKMNVTLPVMIEVYDYHGFDTIQGHMRKIIPGVKVREIGCDGMYFGMAYIGKLTGRQNKLLYTKLMEKKRVLEEEE